VCSAQTAAALEELAKATDSNLADVGDVMVDAAAFTIAMRDANVDKEFSGRLFEFLDEGAHAVPSFSSSAICGTRQEVRGTSVSLVLPPRRCTVTPEAKVRARPARKLWCTHGP